jgi:hypothetical protein
MEPKAKPWADVSQCRFALRSTELQMLKSQALID